MCDQNFLHRKERPLFDKYVLARLFSCSFVSYNHKFNVNDYTQK